MNGTFNTFEQFRGIVVAQAPSQPERPRLNGEWAGGPQLAARIQTRSQQVVHNALKRLPRAANFGLNPGGHVVIQG